MHERIFNVSVGAEFLSNSMTGFVLNFSLKEVYDCMTTSPCFVDVFEGDENPATPEIPGFSSQG